MRGILTVAVLSLLGGTVSAETWRFDGQKAGEPPQGLSCALTGKGRPGTWTVVADATAPSAPNVLAQTDADSTSYRFPHCVAGSAAATDLDLSVRFKPVSGSVDQAAGLVWRYRDPDNYYVVRANALENNVVLYKVEGGRRTDLPVKGEGRTYGKKAPVPSGAWSTLAVRARGRALRGRPRRHEALRGGRRHVRRARASGGLDEGRLGHALRRPAAHGREVARRPRKEREVAMEPVSSRRAVLAALGAGSAALAAGREAFAQAPAAPAPRPPAFRGEHAPRPLPFDPAKLNGLSEKLVRSHWENNYGGAVKALNAVEQRLDVMLADKDLPAYVYGDLKREELVRTGSVVLHEHYFANLGGDGKPSGSALELVKGAFGSYETWEAEFKRTASALGGGSGWVVLALNLHTGEAHNYWAWDHAARAPCWGRPSWSSTCTSTPTTWTSARPRRATWTRSWRTSSGTR